MSLPNINKNLFLVLLFLIGANLCVGQEISISGDVSIRNYYSYDLIGKVNDRIILFRDQGFEKEIDVYDMGMVHKFYTELDLENKKAWVYDIINLDTCFQIIYSYNTKDSIIVRSKKFSEKIQLIDSTTVLVKAKSELKRKFKLIVSEDKSKIALYAPHIGGLLDVSLIQNDSTHLAWNKGITIEDFDIEDDLISTEVSNNGEVFLLFDENNNRYKREEHFGQLVSVSESGTYSTLIDYQSKVTQDVTLNFNNQNQRLFLAGLYNEKDDNKSEGLFIMNEDVNQLGQNHEVELISFNEKFIKEVDNKRKGSSKYLENFLLSDVVFRQDGGVLLFAEMNKVFNRRNPYQSGNNISRDNYSRRGWTDYYNEDVLVMAYTPDNNLEWKKVLYKKQFSQDDEGIYSSYFIFKTPSRLKILYNDEIKKNNTVSQYNLDPLGQSSRKSILSTDYQNLKMRFKSAIQIDSKTILVPSESTYNLNIVKIEYP